MTKSSDDKRKQLSTWLNKELSLPKAAVSTAADGMICLQVKSEDLHGALRKLRDGAYAFSQLSDITAVDYPQRQARFEVVYHLLSMNENMRLRLKVALADGQSVASAQDIYPVADWLEREVWDMYGIFFDNHPDLRRILTDYGFQGHPQRKDFPLTGYVEVRYDSEAGRVRYDKVNLVQDFRDFDFLSPWEGMNREAAKSPNLPGDEKAKQDKSEDA